MHPSFRNYKELIYRITWEKDWPFFNHLSDVQQKQLDVFRNWTAKLRSLQLSITVKLADGVQNEGKIHSHFEETKNTFQKPLDQPELIPLYLNLPELLLDCGMKSF